MLRDARSGFTFARVSEINVTDEAGVEISGLGLFRATRLGNCRAEYLRESLCRIHPSKPKKSWTAF